MQKLNRLVAERVMGFGIDKEHGPCRWSVRLDSPLFGWDGTPISHAPDFCGNIAHAWEVVWEMNTKGWKVCIHQLVEGWEIAFHGSYWAGVCGKHNNERVAICLAALRACGVSEAEIEEATK